VNKDKDHQLVLDLQQGSRTAFRQIFNDYQARLLYYTIAIVKTEGTGKDIVQETFIRLWENRHQLDAGQSLSGYLHTIARNLALNHLKRAAYDKTVKEKIWQEIEETQMRITTSENLYAEESRRLVEEAVNRLPPRRKLIFELSRQNGMTHKEIGVKLDISKNTVKNQIVSAVKEIRVYLNKHSDIALGWMILVILLWI
jgi:RNA polymerase sigma-70 factor (family 1)